MESKEEDVKYIFLYTYLVDSNNNLKISNKDKYYLDSNNLLTQNEIYNLIKSGKEKFNNYPTKIISLLVHNNFSQISTIKSNDSYMFETNPLKDIHFNKTNRYLSKLNSLHIFYKIHQKHNTSKKYIKGNNKKTKKNINYNMISEENKIN